MEESATVGYASPVFRPAPYRPAGFSRFLTSIGRLPAQGWWVYPGLVIVQLAWSHGILWATGLLPVGTFDPVVGFGAIYGPYTLAALGYLNGVAREALRSFWPATGWPEADRPGWAYALTTSPSGYGIRIVVLGIIVSVCAFMAAPAGVVVGDSSERLIVLVAYLPTLLFGYSFVFVAGIHTIRQLRLVSRIHREATAIDPFDRVPLYAFSRLTMQIGLSYILAGYFALTVNGAWQVGNVISLITVTATFTIGLAAFVLPLWGIHGRLVHEKEQLVRGVDRRVDRLAAEMYERVDAGEFDSTKVIADSLQGVRGLGDRIDRLPTWPWPPQLLRGFLTALLLPVIVYIVAHGLSGVLAI